MSSLSALVGEQPRPSQMLSDPGGDCLGESAFQVLQEAMWPLCTSAGGIQGSRQH